MQLYTSAYYTMSYINRDRFLSRKNVRSLNVMRTIIISLKTEFIRVINLNREIRENVIIMV